MVDRRRSGRSLLRCDLTGRCDVRAAPIPSLETELGPPVVVWLREVLPDAIVANEIDGGYGVADLVGAEAPTLSSRMSQPIRESIQLALLDFLDEPKAEAELRRWAPMGWRQLRERGLRPLIDAGAIDIDGSGRFCCAWVEHDPFERMIAVELKLRDWRRAVTQSFRYRLFADASYIAMPTRYAERAVGHASDAGVGVLAVDGTEVREILQPDEQCLIAPGQRRLARERILHALTAGADQPVAGSARGR
jgi:hypothetical protein